MIQSIAELQEEPLEMTKGEICEFLSTHSLGVLGTLSPDGGPQSALVGIAVTTDMEIIFDTVTSSRKFRNLMSEPACSFVVGWAREITVQYEGEAWQPQGAALARYQSVYFAKWPDGPARMKWPGITYFVLRPKWVRYSDFNEDPPVIEELLFDPNR